jgi:heptosyltransferase-2
MKIAVRVCNWIGDVVMNIPALELIRKKYPDAEIVAIGRPWVADVLRFRADLVNRFLPFDDKGEHSGLGGLRKFAKTLRAEGFKKGFVFTKHFRGATAMAMAGISPRAGLKTPETWLFLNAGISFSSLPKSGRHQSRNYVDMVAAAEDCDPDSYYDPPQLTIDDALRDRCVEQFIGEGELKRMIVHAGAAYGTAKRWLPERYAAACRHFLEQHEDGVVVLLGVASEKEVNSTIEAALPAAKVRNLCQKTSLKESLALISSAHLFLSNDSGLMHAAGAFGRPQVAIYGPTDRFATFPLNAQAELVFKDIECSPCFKRHCPLGHHRCMQDVAIEQVVTAMDRRLLV